MSTVISQLKKCICGGEPMFQPQNSEDKDSGWEVYCGKSHCPRRLPYRYGRSLSDMIKEWNEMQFIKNVILRGRNK